MILEVNQSELNQLLRDIDEAPRREIRQLATEGYVSVAGSATPEFMKKLELEHQSGKKATIRFTERASLRMPLDTPMIVRMARQYVLDTGVVPVLNVKMIR